jgi:flagellin-like protein
MKGVSTVIATVLMLVITIALAAMAYGVISGMFTTATQGIEVTDSFCISGTVTLSIKNIGSTAISSVNCTQTAPSGDTSNPCTNTSQAISMVIQPGQMNSFTDTCSGSGGRSCVYRILPPIGKVVQASVYCM